MSARSRQTLAVALLLAALGLIWAGCGGDQDSDPESDAAILGYNEIIRVDQAGNGLLEDSGAGFARTPLNWLFVEPRPGELNFAGIDRIAETLSELGLKPLWVVTSAPCWAVPEPAGCNPREPSLAPAADHIDDYAAFVAAVAERYPEALGIEVWNEPNIPNFWRPRPDADLYRELLATTVETVAASGSDVPLVLGGPSPVIAEEAEVKPTKIVYTEFLERVLRGEDAPAVDAIGLHPYSLLIRSPDPVAKSIELYETAAATLDRLAPGVPIWVTEVGLTTAGRSRVSDSEQADGLRQIYDTFSAARVPVVGIHRFYDQADPPFPFEAGFGVVADDGVTPKPAYCALAATTGASGADACG